MSFSTGLHDVENGCPPWPECYWRNYFNDIAAGKLDPDILVKTRYQDFANGFDPPANALYGSVLGTSYRAESWFKVLDESRS